MSRSRPHVPVQIYIAPSRAARTPNLDKMLVLENGAAGPADADTCLTRVEGPQRNSPPMVGATMALWVPRWRPGAIVNRDVDNEAQGLAAEAAARQNTGRGGGAAGATPPVDVRIEWGGLARRARQLTVPGTAIGGLTPTPEGHSIAVTVASAGGGRGAGTETAARMYTSTRDRQRHACAAGGAADNGVGRRRGRGGAAGGAGAVSNLGST